MQFTFDFLQVGKINLDKPVNLIKGVSNAGQAAIEQLMIGSRTNSFRGGRVAASHHIWGPIL